MLLAYPTVLSTVDDPRPSYPLDPSRAALADANNLRALIRRESSRADEFDEFKDSLVYHWHEPGDGFDITIYRQQLIQQREQALIELSGLGPNHPGRKALETWIGTLDRELAKLDEAVLDAER